MEYKELILLAQSKGEEEKWEEFLEKFDPTNYNSQFISNEEESE